MSRFNRNRRGILDGGRKLFAPLIAHPVVPGSNPVHLRRGRRAVEINRRGDQQHLAVFRHHKDRRAAKLHMQVIVVAG